MKLLLYLLGNYLDKCPFSANVPIVFILHLLYQSTGPFLLMRFCVTALLEQCRGLFFANLSGHVDASTKLTNIRHPQTVCDTACVRSVVSSREEEKPEKLLGNAWHKLPTT